MERLRTIVIGVEGLALVGIVTFTVAGITNSRQMAFTILSYICGGVILAGELVVHRLNSKQGE